MRATVILVATVVCVTIATGLNAQQPTVGATITTPKTIALHLPATVDGCLEFVEKVLEHALEADLLDDQIEQSEAELEEMENACHEKRFSDALQSAKTIADIVATNK